MLYRVHLTMNEVELTTFVTVTKYPYLKWQYIFYFLRIDFLSSIIVNTFIGYISNTTGIL
jgi:hypothetical protein